MEQWNKIQQDKQKHLIPSYILEKRKLESSIVQSSTPELFNTDWEQPQSEKILSIPVTKPTISTKIIRPHSAG